VTRPPDATVATRISKGYIKVTFDLDQRFERLKGIWYNNINVLFNIIDGLKYREAIFLRKGTVHRCLKINKIDYFKLNAKRYHFWDEPLNIYGSLAHYPNMPMFSHNIKEKRAEMDSFNEEYLDYMTGYDFLMDIDNRDLELALGSLLSIKKIFDDYQVPYYCVFSGTKGFHLKVTYEDFDDDLKALSFPTLAKKFKQFSYNFKTINGFDDIDTSIYDLRRIAKTQYSVVYPYYFVALPLSDEQLAEFRLEMVTLPYLLNRVGSLYKRGILKRPGTKQGFSMLIKDYGEI
jgi:hypothetical protein